MLLKLSNSTTNDKFDAVNNCRRIFFDLCVEGDNDVRKQHVTAFNTETYLR